MDFDEYCKRSDALGEKIAQQLKEIKELKAALDEQEQELKDMRQSLEELQK